MKVDSQKVGKWLNEIEVSLPKLCETILSSQNEILVIGKSVYYLFFTLDLIPQPKTSTGDIDLSVGIAQNFEDYDDIKQNLLRSGYIADSDPEYPFRFHSPKITPGTINYVDLLIHPKGEFDEKKYRDKMGVGPEWNFQGVLNGLNNPFHLRGSLYSPNPLGLIGQKAQSYFIEPNWRRRDLADIIELVDGLVAKGTHFKLSEVWQSMMIKNEMQCKVIEECIKGLADIHNVQWDCENVSDELIGRRYTQVDIEDRLPRQASDFVEQVFE